MNKRKSQSLEDTLEKRLEFFDSVIPYFNLNNNTHTRTLKRLDLFAKKFEYDPILIKEALKKIQNGEYGIFYINGKKYNIKEKDTKFILGVVVKKNEGGLLPILPLLLGGIGLYGANKLKDIIKEKINSFKEEKTGGILPLIPLLGLIFGGVAAAGSVAGGISTAVQAANKTAAENERTKIAEDQARKDDELRKAQLEAIKGKGLIEDASKIVNEAGKKVKGFFESIPDKIKEYKQIFSGEGLGEDFDIEEIEYDGHPRLLISHKGNGIHLPRLGQGIHLPRLGQGIMLPKIDLQT